MQPILMRRSAYSPPRDVIIAADRRTNRRDHVGETEMIATRNGEELKSCKRREEEVRRGEKKRDEARE